MSSQKKFTFAISFPDEFLVLLNFSKLPTQILQKIAKNAFQAVILRYFSEIGIASGAHCVKVVEDMSLPKLSATEM